MLEKWCLHISSTFVNTSFISEAVVSSSSQLPESVSVNWQTEGGEWCEDESAAAPTEEALTTPECETEDTRPVSVLSKRSTRNAGYYVYIHVSVSWRPLVGMISPTAERRKVGETAQGVQSLQRTFRFWSAGLSLWGHRGFCDTLSCSVRPHWPSYCSWYYYYYYCYV